MNNGLEFLTDPDRFDEWCGSLQDQLDALRPVLVRQPVDPGGYGKTGRSTKRPPIRPSRAVSRRVLSDMASYLNLPTEPVPQPEAVGTARPDPIIGSEACVERSRDQLMDIVHGVGEAALASRGLQHGL